jgi:hypothetical protein
MEKYRLIAVVAAIFIAIFADFFFPFLVPQVIELNHHSLIVR